MDIGTADKSGRPDDSDGPDNPGRPGDNGRPHDPGRYAPSPLVAYAAALETASALLVMQVSPEVINFELRRQHGFTEAQAAVLIHEAAAQIPGRDLRSLPSHSPDRPRLPQRRAG